MKTIRLLGLAPALLLLASCGSGSAASTPAPTMTASAISAPETSATPKDELGIPELPSPLPVVSDPGTVDPVLGTFPASSARKYQYAWVKYAGVGRTMVEAARDADESGALRDQNERDIYRAGTEACVDLAGNNPVSSVLKWTTQFFDKDADYTKVSYDGAIVAMSITKMCTELTPMLKNLDWLSPTGAMIRSQIGVDEVALPDEKANKFANWVCSTMKGGQTKSRIVTAVATKYGYPDDLTESLVGRVSDINC